jgi:CSLREA domain-containing protein
MNSRKHDMTVPSRRRVRLGIALVVCAASALAAPCAQAAITVNTTADPGGAGQCSLRKAIQAANSRSPAGDCAAADPASSTTTINVPTGHYTLASQLEITGSARVFIQGASSADPSQTVVDGAQHDRVLMVDSGAIVAIDGLTVTGGKTADGGPGGCCRTVDYNPHAGDPGGAGGDGGGIYNSGTLTLTNAAITGNATGHGGDGGTGGSGDSSNWNGGRGGDGGSGGNGGGIYNYYFATLSLIRTSVRDNHTGTGGFGGQGGRGVTSPPPNPCSVPCGGVNGSAGGPGGAGGAGGFGGGIEDHGAQLTLTDSTLSANTTGQGGDAGGGGLGSDGTAGDSSAPGGGGAGGGWGGGDPNAWGGSGGFGGGIDDQGKSLTITRTTISANVLGNGGSGGLGGGGGNGSGAAGGIGGAASKGGVGGAGAGVRLDVYTPLAVDNSTFTGNSAGAGGSGGNGGSGGFGSTRGPAASGADGGWGGNGGGLFTNQGTLTNVTIAENQAGGGGSGGAPGQGCQPGCASGPPSAGSTGIPGGGGGIDVNGTPGISLTNTLVASNHVVGAVQNCVNHTSSAIGDGGHNLSFPDTSCPGTNGDPVLEPLQNNGGPTQTMALGSGSAAIDQIPQGAPDCPGTDQRGVSRPYPAGGQCDIGAFEGGPVQRTFRVSISGGGSGTVTGPGIDCGGGPTQTACSTTAADGTQVMLTATPAAGSTFGAFTGGGCGASSPCTVMISADTLVEARFDPPPAPPLSTPPTGTGGGSGAGAGAGTGSGAGAGSGIKLVGKVTIGHPKVKGATVTIPVSCAGAVGATCSISAELSVTEKLLGGKVIAVTTGRHPKTKTRRHTLGFAHIVINAGQVRTVRVSLNRAGQRLLATRHGLKVALALVQSGQATFASPITFKFNKARKPR